MGMGAGVSGVLLHRVTARLAVLSVLSTLLLTTSPDLASGQSADDANSYRGWIATSRTFDSEYFAAGDSLYTARTWVVDTDPSSTKAVWSANIYYRHQEAGEWDCQKSEQAGVISGGRASLTPGRAVASERESHGLAAGTEMFAFSPEGVTNPEPTGSGVQWYCGDPEKHDMPFTESTAPDVAALPWPAASSWPSSAMRSGYSYINEQGALNTAVVCMTRETADRDEDGLPDAVDLDPERRGTPENLGDPGGLPGTAIEPQFDGPAGVQGLPSCPSAPYAAKSLMVALGDSYSSGEGAYAYEPATDVRGVNHCHRSRVSYPFTAFNALKASGYALDGVQSLACSGATVENLRPSSGVPFCGSGCHGSEARREPPQVEELARIAKLSNVEVVTLGIGGNDGGFADVIAGCFAGTNCVSKFDPAAGGELPGASIPEIQNRVTRLLPQIRDVAPDAMIVVVGYPVFIDKAYGGCPGSIGSNEAEWIRGQILDMNLALEQAAKNADGSIGRVRYLSLDEVYGNHVLCNADAAPQWLHDLNVSTRPVSDGCTISQKKLSFYEAGTGIYVCNESFHPKADGHAATGRALAACIRDTVCGSASTETVRTARELAGMPALVPTGEGGANCTGPTPFCIRPGHGYAVKASGFQPGTPVSVDLFSRGAHLAEVVADADGNVSAEFDIEPGTVMPGEHRLVLTGPGENAIVRSAEVKVTVTCETGLGDIPSTHPVCADVVWLRSTNVTHGYPDATYRPAGTVSRRQMASFLWRLAGEQAIPEGAPTFTDTADEPTVDAIRWLSGVGITTGYPDGRFGPGDGLTRGQMASFLWRFAGEPPVPADAPTYSDVPPTHPHANGIRWMGSQNITVGKADGTFGPGDTLIRKHMASFLRRFGEPRGLPE